MDVAFMIKALPAFGRAMVLTTELAALGIAASLVIGAISAAIIHARTPVLNRLAGLYVEASRNTPLMIQLFFLYFGLPRVGLRLEAETCAVVGLAFLGGGYMAESFRGGLEAVGKSQIESGLCVGLDRLQLLYHVVWPQALAVAMPALGANAVFLVRETSVLGVVALADIMYVANDLMMDGRGDETNLLMVVSYLILILPLSRALLHLERRLRRVGFAC
jgi:polar amino acid transport system permease protein